MTFAVGRSKRSIVLVVRVNHRDRWLSWLVYIYAFRDDSLLVRYIHNMFEMVGEAECLLAQRY